MKIKVRKTLNGWMPADEESIKYHHKFNLNDIYHIDVSRFKDQRTIELNGLYWAILNIVVENQEIYVSDKHLHKIMKKTLIIVEPLYNPVTDAMEADEASTAFENMDNDLFKAYFKDALQFIQIYVLPGVTEYELIEAACKRMPLRAENRNWVNENFKAR